MANAWGLDPETWDMRLVGNEIERLSGVDEIAQFLKQKIWFFYEEWFLDRDAGVPWFQEIWVKPENKGLADSYLKDQIVNTKGVLELLEFKSTFNFSKREYKVTTFTVRTEYGLLTETL